VQVVTGISKDYTAFAVSDFSRDHTFYSDCLFLNMKVI